MNPDGSSKQGWYHVINRQIAGQEGGTSFGKPEASRPVEFGYLKDHIPEAWLIIGGQFDPETNTLYPMSAGDRLQSSYK